MNPTAVPCRVDFAGGWLDVPAFAIKGAYVVNCAISPLVTLEDWPYERNAGVGGSAAWCVLNGEDALASELKFSGWQDPAIILETGLCVWRSGPLPVLDAKVNPEWLRGLMALWYSGKPHSTADLRALPRNYPELAKASQSAAEAVKEANLSKLAEAINQTHNVQLAEGMEHVPSALRALAYKYVGSGHGGYVFYLFADSKDRDQFVDKAAGMAIEPFLERHDRAQI